MVVGDVCSVFHRQDLAQIVNYFLLHCYDRYRVKGYCCGRHQGSDLHLRQCSVQPLGSALLLRQCSVQRRGSALHLRQCSVQRRGSALHLRQFSVQRRRGSGLLKSFAACSSCDLNICFIFFDWLLYSIFSLSFQSLTLQINSFHNSLPTAALHQKSKEI